MQALLAPKSEISVQVDAVGTTNYATESTDMKVE